MSEEDELEQQAEAVVVVAEAAASVVDKYPAPNYSEVVQERRPCRLFEALSNVRIGHVRFVLCA